MKYKYLFKFSKRNIIILAMLVLLASWVIIHKYHVHVRSKIKTDNYVLLNSGDVISVKTGIVDNVISFTGDLSPLNQVIISSEVDAIAIKVLVTEGQLVKKGQVLAVLDDSDLKHAVIEQSAYLANLQAKSVLDKQKLNSEKGLFEQGFISKISYDELVMNERMSTQAIKQQQASLQRAKKRLNDTVIKAPFSGYIYQKSIETGQLASNNSKLFALASLDVLQIKAAIASDQVNSIKINQEVKFKVETSKELYVGKVTRINPVAEVGTRSYMIYVNFNNTKYNLKSGQFVKGTITLNSLNTHYIQTESIRYSGSGAYVLALINGKVVIKPIKILINNTVIGVSGVEGVTDGETILSQNVLTVNPGDMAKVID